MFRINIKFAQACFQVNKLRKKIKDSKKCFNVSRKAALQTDWQLTMIFESECYINYISICQKKHQEQQHQQQQKLPTNAFNRRKVSLKSNS